MLVPLSSLSEIPLNITSDFMITAFEITKRLFVWGVVAISVCPRQHIDRGRWSIGGDLSHSFRKLLLTITAMNFARLVLNETDIRSYFQVLADGLGVMQQLGCSFLCFLTPYILQTWLAPLINIGGRPGASLMKPLYLATFLSVTSVILVRTTHTNFWCLRKLGSAISAFPVLKTLDMFSRVTTRSAGGTEHDGRGSIISQTLKIVEYWFLIIQLLCALGFAFDRNNLPEEYNQIDHVLSAFREIAFISDWTRICAHAIFINQLDELYLTSPRASSGGSTGRSTTMDPEAQEQRQPKDNISGFLVARRQ